MTTKIRIKIIFLMHTPEQINQIKIIVVGFIKVKVLLCKRNVLKHFVFLTLHLNNTGINHHYDQATWWLLAGFVSAFYFDFQKFVRESK